MFKLPREYFNDTNEYYCTKCKHKHKHNTNKGREHQQHKQR